MLLFFVDNLHCSVIKFLCLTACRSPPKMSNLLWLTLAYQTKQRSLSATIIDWHDLLLHILCYMHIDLSLIHSGHDLLLHILCYMHIDLSLIHCGLNLLLHILCYMHIDLSLIHCGHNLLLHILCYMHIYLSFIHCGHNLLLHILCYMHIDLSFIAGTISCYTYCVIFR